MKTFFDGVFVSSKHLEEADIEYPIKLEYFKTLEEENVGEKFGIEVVKTEFLDTRVNVETKEIKNITNNIEEADKILEILRNNEVTPIGVEDVLQEILPKNLEKATIN